MAKYSKRAGKAKGRTTTSPNIVIVAQDGRLAYEAILFAATLRHSDPDFKGRLLVAEPQPGDLWLEDPRLKPQIRETLEMLGAEIVPFECKQFGRHYPYGNKIEALLALPKGEPFLFFDTDTVITGKLSEMPIPYVRPSASMKREDTWPTIELYGPGYTQIWKSLYDKFGLDFEASLDLSQPDEYWQRYMYFNAGWFFGPCPREFGKRFKDYAVAIHHDGPEEIVCQTLYPWLDQIALPLVISSFGGGRPGPELDGLDGDVTCHWRILPLAYARESDKVIETIEAATAPNKIKKILKEYDPMKRMIFQGRGQKVRALFDQNNLPHKEQAIRNTIKREGFWMR